MEDSQRPSAHEASRPSTRHHLHPTVKTIQKVLALFDRRDKWMLLWLSGLTVAMALIQTIGVASIMPFMNLVGNPELIEESHWLAWLHQRVGLDGHRPFLIFIGAMVLFVMAFSNGFTAMTNWLLIRFTWRQENKVAVRLLAKYLHEPYTFYLNRNTADLAKNILAEVREVIRGVIKPGMMIFAQIVVTICIFSLLIVVNPLLASGSALVLGGAYAVLYSVVRRRQARLGSIRLAASADRFKAAAEALGGIKETMVLGRQDLFLKRFAKPASRFSRVNASNALITTLPRYALETLAFGGIIVIILYLLYTENDFGQVMAVVSVFALAGYRLMPALQEIFHGLAKIRFFGAALDDLHHELVGRPAPAIASVRDRVESAEPLPFKDRITLDGISFRYPGQEEWVVRELSLEIPRNSTVGFVGSTGSGKTTVADIILGLLQPEDGEIRIDGNPLTPHNIAHWRTKLGYVPQHIFLCDDTLTNNIAFGIPDKDIDHGAVERAARIANLHEFIESLPAGYGTVVGDRGVRLSGGQRQRIGIARALYHDPDIVVMDEATSALDNVTEADVMLALSMLSGAKTLILIAHRLTSLRRCSTIIILEAGTVVASGDYATLLHNSPTFRKMASAGAASLAAH
jgi:ATP-binding cassette, subfamily B, bacterial PglK